MTYACFVSQRQTVYFRTQYYILVNNLCTLESNCFNSYSSLLLFSNIILGKFSKSFRTFPYLQDEVIMLFILELRDLNYMTYVVHLKIFNTKSSAPLYYHSLQRCHYACVLQMKEITDTTKCNIAGYLVNFTIISELLEYKLWWVDQQKYNYTNGNDMKWIIKC